MRKSEVDYAINKYRHRFLHERFKNLEISRAEATYLIKIVKSGNQVKMNDLINELFFHKSHATRAINKMVDDKLLIKEKNPDDLRGYLLIVTDKGRAIAEKIKKVFSDWDDLVNEVITDEERQMIQNMSIKIFHRLQQYYNEEDTISEHII